MMKKTSTWAESGSSAAHTPEASSAKDDSLHIFRERRLERRLEDIVLIAEFHGLVPARQSLGLRHLDGSLKS